MARVIKEWISKDGSFAIKVNDDMSYQILKDGEVINTNHAMDKWYDTAGQVATHIQKKKIPTSADGWRGRDFLLG
jgi:hypothetical protein